jgi:hypothetical protein
VPSGEATDHFHRQHALGTSGGTTIVNMNNDTILKVNLEDLPDD